ncbi:MAG TPA: MFS transporter [Bacteroidales bacterium]|nr:MFS transporter [Bacteroidales bacterium]HPS15839.1 MFS transporter [Bacteroidales bacterium]
MIEEKSAGRNALLAVILISSFFNPFMGAAVNIALPQIGNDFSMNAIGLSWVSMAFLLSSAIFLIPFGKAGDIWGRKKLFLYGNILFTLATLGCAFSFSEEIFLSFRFLQGVGGAMVGGTSMALITSAFPPNQRGKAIGMSVSAVYIGLSAAPLFGGMLTQAFGWHSLFYINATVGLFVIILTITSVRSEWQEAKGEKFDYVGSLIYIISMSALMFGLVKNSGLLSEILIVGGFAGLIFFIFLELKISSPILNVNLFRNNRTFAFSNLASLINYAATFAITFMLSLYLQNVRGLSPSDAGLLLVTQPVLMAVVAIFSGRLSDKIDSRILSSLGMSIIVIGLILLTFIKTDTPNIYLISSLAILGMGFGLFSSPNTNAVMSSVEKKFLGVASGINSTMRMTGQMVSMAIAALVIHIYVGEKKIEADTIPQYMTTLKVIFAVFAVLCFLGVFASLARGKKVEPSSLK